MSETTMTAHDLIQEVYESHINEGVAPRKRSVLATLKDPKYFEGDEEVTDELRMEALYLLDEWWQSAVENALCELNDDDLISRWNNYCDANYREDKVYYNNDPTVMIHNQGFYYDFADKYVIIKDEELESFDDLDLLDHISISDLADWMILYELECEVL